MTDRAGSFDSAYATAGWGIHDERWFTALTAVGRHPERLALGHDVDSANALRARVADAVGSGRPVLAGPLHTVTHHLQRLPGIIGLSWGHDLLDLDAEGSDLTWLAGLSGLVVDSRATRAIAERSGLDPARITYLPWGIDLRAFEQTGPLASPADVGLPQCTGYVLSLRAHEPLYRIADIVEAFATFHAARPDIGLVIGHGGSLTDDLRALVVERGISAVTSFIGTVPEAELPPLLRGAACYVTASRVDGTSVTLLQAMACGTPVVASANPGNVDWVEEHRTGVLFRIGDTGALATGLMAACARGPEVAEWTREARERVQSRADWTANISRLRGAMDAGAQDLRPRLSP